MGASDDIVMFGQCKRPANGEACGSVHIAIAPVPHREQWTAECGIVLPASDKSVSVMHGASIIDARSTRVFWLPPGAHMEDACYKCVRRAGATHVAGMWHAAPPPPPQPLPARMRQRMATLAPRASARGRRRPAA